MSFWAGSKHCVCKKRKRVLSRLLRPVLQRTIQMTSPTDITKKRRRAKKAAVGKDRKRVLNNQGSTPELFKLNRPTAAELKTKS